jgi:hypothetical protein
MKDRIAMMGDKMKANGQKAHWDDQTTKVDNVPKVE